MGIIDKVESYTVCQNGFPKSPSPRPSPHPMRRGCCLSFFFFVYFVYFVVAQQARRRAVTTKYTNHTKETYGQHAASSAKSKAYCLPKWISEEPLSPSDGERVAEGRV